MSEPKEEYLGDGAYIRDERGTTGFVVIYTFNGIHPTNSIFFEREVWQALKSYIEREAKK